MSAIQFLRQFVRRPASVGALSPSSRALAELLVEEAAIHNASSVIEFGPGTGAITEAISDGLSSDANFLAIEKNPVFCALLRERFPQWTIIEDSATNAGIHLRNAGLDECDAVICGLPLASFDDQLQNEIIGEAHRVLRKGGTFVAFSYLHSPYFPQGGKVRETFLKRFDTVEKSRMVWSNFPPAFVYTAHK